MSAPDFNQEQGDGRGLGRVPTPQVSPVPRPRSSEALEGLPAPTSGRSDLELPAPSASLGGDLIPDVDGGSLSAIQYFFDRKAKKEQRIGNARSLREQVGAIQLRLTEITPPAVQWLNVEPVEAVGPDAVSAALERLREQGQADDFQRLISSFPVFGGGEDRIVREDELEGLLPEYVGIENAIIALRTADLVEPLETIGEWQLTPLGSAVVRELMLSTDLETSAHVLDAQTAFLTARLAESPRSAGAFLEAATYLLAHGLLESENGHPTRWGTAMRAIRNGVVVDLERPGSLLEGAGGLRSRDLAALGGMAQVSPLAEGSFPPEFRTMVVVLAARERVQAAVGKDPERLRQVLLSPEIYQDLDKQMVGLKAMAHVAWVALSREATPRDAQIMAESLAHAATGVRPGGVFRPADFAVLTPDHREHLLLLAAARENPGFSIVGTMDEARRRLAMVYGQLVEEYPHLAERSRAAARILALHTGYSQTEPGELQWEAERVMDQVEESHAFSDEITTLAMRLQPGMYGKDTAPLALHSLVRRCSDTDRGPDYVDTMVAAAEWVSVAERVSTFRSMREAQVYRYALMEALERPGFKKPQRDAMGRMLDHATVLMTVLAQQDQARVMPLLDKEVMASLSTSQVVEIIEGEGGRFGVARIPWQESEREQAFRRIVEYSGLRVAFPEEMNMVSRNLLRLLGTHVGPGEPRRKADVPQKEMLAQRVGEVPEDLTEADARDGLAFLQAVEGAKESGLLRTFPAAGVTVEEAAMAHDTDAE